ncbi:nucleoside deaminase [Acidaminococcus intestini]|nr:nucleoside deaminase [Acidaminococcus intestini]
MARNHNRRERAHDATAHAEILVIREACEKLRRWRLADSTLYVTMEPCPMCAGAIYNARIGRVVFGASDSVAGACGSLFQIPSTPVSMQIPSSKPVSKQSAVKKFCRNFLHGAVNMI